MIISSFLYRAKISTYHHTFPLVGGKVGGKVTLLKTLPDITDFSYEVRG